jgi:2,5-furandicarboxylate decarboxylase 1
VANSADETARQSLRGFLAMVERDFPEELLRIRGPVRTHLDITSLVFELERAGKSPVVIYENVEGHTMPVVTNIAGNRKLLAACLGVEPANLPTAFRERCQKYIPCEVVKDAPWQEVVLEGDQVDLTKLPIPLHFSVDAAPYITAGQIAARDPLTGVDTTGFHRLMVKGKNRLGVSLHSRRRMHEFHRRAEERGHALPAAITLGIHPLHYMGSMVYAYPPHVRKCPAGRATALPDSCRALDFSWSGWSCAGRRLDQGRGARKPRLASNLRNYWPRGGGAQGQYSKTAQSLRR